MLLLFRKLIAYVVLTLCLFAARAQQSTVPFASLNLNRLTVDEGLSQVYVNVLFKDSEGFLWVGTDDGLNRYDGKEVLRYYYRFDDNSTMAANEVYGICEDRKGRIWLAHYNAGISIFDKKTNRFTRLSTGSGKLSSNRVYGLYCDRDGFVVARTVEGLSKINAETLAVQNFDRPAYQDLANTAHIDVVEQGGQYWFGSTSKGVLRVGRQGQVLSATAWDVDHYGKSVFGLCKISETQLLVASEKGLFRLQISGEEFNVETILMEPSLFAYASKLIRYENSPYVWVATDQQGLLIVDLQQRKVVRHFRSEWVKDNLLSNSVLFLLQDNERNVFIGTSRGVNIYSPYNNLFNNYENVFRKFPAFGHPIYAIHELQDGNLLLGTGKGGAYYFDVNTLEAKPIAIEGDNIAGKKTVIYHFTPLDAQQFLVATNDGIYELSLAVKPLKLIRSKRFHELAALSANPVTDIYLQNDSIAWIASFTTGLFRWNYRMHKLQQFIKNEKQPDQGPVDNQLQKIVPTKGGHLILCTKYGFSVFDPSSNRFENVPPGKNYPYELPARNVKYAYDDGSAIWVTTYGAGVQKWDKVKRVFTGYTTTEGLPNDAVYSVIPDNYGRLWMGTNNGLAVLDPKSGKIRTYTTKDGLPDNEFNGHSAYKSASGKLFYSTLNGIISVSPFLENSN
ncbi:MAG TPA: two-component regulator propeller domain-containing protein, partial [Flavisolibacter sp.]|nr:two-component regulator propeller domain-containing protein [Flavisolibacter sp.]